MLAWGSTSPAAGHALLVSADMVEGNRAIGLRSFIVLDHGFRAGRAYGARGPPSAVLLDRERKIASELAVGVPAVGAARHRAASESVCKPPCERAEVYSDRFDGLIGLEAPWPEWPRSSSAGRRSRREVECLVCFAALPGDETCLAIALSEDQRCPEDRCGDGTCPDPAGRCDDAGSPWGPVTGEHQLMPRLPWEGCIPPLGSKRT
jgi:hypothetical protein